MSETKIVDAVKTEVCNTNSSSVNVPIKLDTSALVKAMQAAAAQQETKVDPSVLIKNSAIKMEELYRQFDQLKAIFGELSGKPFNSPLPTTLRVDEISFKFRVVKENNPGIPQTAVVKNVVCVGDIANLLSSEIGSIIVQLQAEAAAVKDVAQRTEETTTKARENWETGNPDRKFAAAGDQSVAQVTDGATGV